MATRVNRKNAANPPKEIVAAEKPNSKNDSAVDASGSKSVTKPTPIGKRLAKKNAKIVKKPSLALKLKAKGRTTRLNPLSKNGQKVKTAENKKKILSNVVKKKMPVKKSKDESVPVLEPIYPIEENNIEIKKPGKKRGPKKTQKSIPDLIEVKNIKVEADEDISLSSDITDISNQDIPNQPKQIKKGKGVKKGKADPDTLEDIMNDLSYLIKEEPKDDSMSESGKSDSTLTKPKKLTKKQRIDLLQKTIIKKENIENTLNKFDSADEKVIDMLDLNVRRVKRKANPTKRRHSIEKFSMATENVKNSQITLFQHLPRSISPRSKINLKMRQGIDGISRRSPYTTRSDSPARMLRNGKQRKLKDMHLMDGLDNEVRKRRRLCSDLSEISGSKLSGYESDSSFSDMASSHGTENADVKDLDTKLFEETDMKSPIIKTTCDVMNGPNNLSIVDTNSNVCTNNLNENKLNVVPIDLNSTCNIESSSKVPEKSILLNIMKQNFNQVTPKTVEAGGSSAVEMPTISTHSFYDKVPTAYQEEDKTSSDSVTINRLVTACEQETQTSLDAIEDEITENEPFKKPEAETRFEPMEEDNKESVENSRDNCGDTAKDMEYKNLQEEDMELEPCATAAIEETANKIIQTGSENNDTSVDISDISKQSFETDEFTLRMDVDDPENEMNESKVETNDPQNETNNLHSQIGETDYNNAEMTDNNAEMNDNEPEMNDNSSAINDNEPEINDNSSAINNSGAEMNDNNAEMNENNAVMNDNIAEVDENIAEMNDNIAKMNDNNADISDRHNDMNSPAIEDNEAEIGDQVETVNNEEVAATLAEKEYILKALGLQSLKDAEENKQKFKEKAVVKGETYTGTLKTVIKINRDKKKGRKFNAHKYKTKTDDEDAIAGDDSPREHYKVVKEAATATWKQGAQSSDTAGARKTHYSNRSNLDGSSEHTSDGETAPTNTSQDGVIKALVIPEKASSFSIHPGRLCKDECSYCFGKFGLFDTPCHIAQMKSVERQDKILKIEVQLMRDSCLCDACYRHVDRKANTPSYTNKSIKRNSLVAPGPRQNHCHVLGCNRMSSNILRRKWIIKMRKSICQVINIDLDNPGLHSIPICDEHYSALEHLMLCAMCKRRLAKNHIHYLGPEMAELNELLTKEGIPVMLTDKPVVCKLCKCFASIILKDNDDRPENSNNFFREYKKRLLHFNDIVPMDEAEAEEPIAVPGKSEKTESSKKKKRLGKGSTAGESTGEDSGEQPERIKDRVPSSDSASQPQSRSESPADEYNGVDYNTLIPAIAMDCGSDTDSRKEPLKKFIISSKKVDMGKTEDKDQISELAVQKLGSNPSISVRQLFPGEEDLPLSAHVDFQNVKDKTPEGWEKCSSLIQYDLETKKLWHELQKPYGNQSSFLRHLILLEKYFRNGDLVLSPRASHHSINYSESVHNRLRAYDNIPSSAGNIQPISMLPFNKMQRSSSGIITGASSATGSTSMTGPIITSVSSLSLKQSLPISSAAKNSPITLSQLNSPPLIPATSILSRKVGPVAPPPGLMPLHPGTARPVAPLVKLPQPQKIKFPITKNWRPNLIPIDPTKKIERKNGLVQVISGGKPYHITLEDYKKMCAIKRSFEMKQKRLQEAQSAKPILVTHNSMLKSIIPRKGLIISKTSAPPSVSVSHLKPETEINGEGENILDKLDRQVEKLESRLNEGSSSSLFLPKIPKSLTVIPQTVTRKPSRPSSPELMITPKNRS